jgi:hypothetical protein
MPPKQLTPEDLKWICEAEYVDSPEGMVTNCGQLNVLEAILPYSKILIKKMPDAEVQNFKSPACRFYLRFKGVEVRPEYKRFLRPASDNG